MEDILGGANLDSVKNGEELQPLSNFIDDREKMIEQAFSVLKGKALYNVIPQSLKNVPVEVLKADALVVLLGMSRKRIFATIEGQNLSSSSDSESDSSDSDDDDDSHNATNSKENSVIPGKRCVSDSETSSDSSDSSGKEHLEDLISKQIKGMKEKLEKRESSKKLKKKKEPKKKKAKKQRKKRKASSSSSETDESTDEADDSKMEIFPVTNWQRKKTKRKKRKADCSLSETDESADEIYDNKMDIEQNSQKKKKKRKKKKGGSSSSETETAAAINSKGELVTSQTEEAEKNGDNPEGKSLMDILELEMRAKAIRALLSKNKKIEFDENGKLVIPSSSDEETEKSKRDSVNDENISSQKLTNSVSESPRNNKGNGVYEKEITSKGTIADRVEKEISMDIFSKDDVVAPKIEESVIAQKQTITENHVEHSGVVEKVVEPSKMEEKSRDTEQPDVNNPQPLESKLTENLECARMKKLTEENCVKTAAEECGTAHDLVSSSKEIELSEGELNDSGNENEKRITNVANPSLDKDSGELTSDSETETVKVQNENKDNSDEDIEDTQTRRSVELDHIMKFSEPSENLDSDDEFSKGKMASNSKLIDKSNVELFLPKEKNKRKKNVAKDLSDSDSSMDEEALLAQIEELKRAALSVSGDFDTIEVKPKKKKRKAKKKSAKPKKKSKKSEESSVSSEEKFLDSGDEDNKGSLSNNEEDNAQPKDWAQRWLESKNVQKAMVTSMIYSDMKKKIKEAKAKGLITTKTLLSESAIPQRIRSSSGKKKKKKSRK